MHPVDCGEWEYTTHPLYSGLDWRCSASLNSLFAPNNVSISSLMGDTRPVHANWFEQLTPSGQGYLAGNYRGSSHHCLEFRPVFIAKNSGTKPDLVATEMANFHAELARVMATLDLKLTALQSASGKKKPAIRAEFIVQLGEIAAAFYILFLVIHPYANGNGHISRWIVWLILIRAKHHPKTWPLNARPPTNQLIQQYRDGETEPLVRFIIKAIRGH